VPAKEDLLLAPVRHGGAAIVQLLEQRPTREQPDVALINAIVARIRSFDQVDIAEWREALRVAPGLLDKATIHRPADKERAAKLIAERMGADPEDIRPGLLIQLAFAAADFAFQRWVRRPASPQPLDLYVADALEAVKSPHWKRTPPR